MPKADDSMQRAVLYHLWVPTLFEKAAHMYLAKASPLFLDAHRTDSRRTEFTIIVGIKEEGISDALAQLIAYMKQHTVERAVWICNPVTYKESPEV